MTVPTATQNGLVKLNSTDANVPLLAIEAANEIDELIEGRPAELQSVARLAEVLKQSFPLGGAGGGTKGGGTDFVDSGTVTVFSQALDEYCHGRTISTMKELVEHAIEIVKTLETAKKDSPTAGLEKLRDFCIALSSAASAFQESVFEIAPDNPLHT